MFAATETSAGRMAALFALVVALRERAGRRMLRQLESTLGSIETWWPNRQARLPGLGLPEGVFAALVDPALESRAEGALEALRRAGFEAVEASTCSRLDCLPDAPTLLFLRGRRDLPESAIGVVGARRATAYGLRATRRLVAPVAAAGVVIVSGLARGIDAEAHGAALSVGGRTVAVLGSGPDRAYPPEHRDLQERIGQEGLLVTEYLPGTPPLPHHFPRRNRILVALAQALLIVEARLGSGSLTSVRWAADLGREVLVVPGPIDSQLSEAPITLLREGATAVGSPDHILEAVGLSVMAPRAPALGSPTELSPAEGRLLALLEGGGADVDDLIVLSGESPSRVLSLVLALEARGLIVREADGRSVRANRPSPEGRAAVHELSEEVQRGAAERDVDQVPAEGPDSHAHDVP